MQILILVFILLMAQVFLKSSSLYLVRWQTWFYIYVIGTSLDIMSTYFGLNALGIDAENNATARFLFERVGIVEGLIIHGALSLFLFFIAGMLLGKHRDWGVLTRCTIFTIAMGRFAATINNLLVA